MAANSARAKAALLAGVASATLLLSGCSLNKAIGDGMVKFSKTDMIPYLMSMDDPHVACVNGEANAPLLLTFERAGTNVNQLGVLIQMTTGGCAEQEANEQELRYLRASKAGQTAEAMDARAAQKTWNALAAQRYYAGYRRLVAFYGEPGEACPTWRLRRELDQLAYLLGLITGVQAVVQDVAAERAVDVPMDIAAKADRAASCLDNEKWWGMPQAIHAAVALLNPTIDAQGKDPWQELAQAAAIGEKAGVRLPHVFQAMVAQTKGDDVRLRQAIKAFVAAGEKGQVNERYRMIDRVAVQTMKAVSDRYWTEHTGQRTPHLQLGHFWDEKAAPTPTVALDDIL